MKKIPFEKVFITGLICDHEGKKMSKSKGNVLDPIDIIDGICLEDLIQKRTYGLMLQSTQQKIIEATKKQFPNGIPAYGTDALRFTYCALATNTRTIRFDLQRVEGYRNFCNKLWNAARFVLSQIEANPIQPNVAKIYSPADQWIQSILQKTIDQAHQHFANYRFDLLANTLYDFVWHEYCDWYLELAKTVLYSTECDEKLKQGASYTLSHVLNQILKLLHPIIPFITEEIWLRLNHITDDHQTIMYSEYPQVSTTHINHAIEEEFSWLKEFTQAVRTLRSEMNISPSKKIPLLLKGFQQYHVMVEKYQTILYAFMKLSNIEWIDEQESIPMCTTLIIQNLEIFIPMNDLIDKDAELMRIKKEQQKLNAEIERIETKLNNPSFVEKAPEAVIIKEKEKLAQFKIALDKQNIHLLKIESL